MSRIRWDITVIESVKGIMPGLLLLTTLLLAASITNLILSSRSGHSGKQATILSDISHYDSGVSIEASSGFPFGYYGLEEPEVENSGFSPRVHIDSGMSPTDIPIVMGMAESGGVQVYQYLPPGALSLPLTELRDQWVEPAVSYPDNVMAGFYPSEEPGDNEIPAMIDFLNLVHETDPLSRPVVTYLGYANVSNIERFQDTVDIDLLGAYPVFKGYPQGFMTGMMDSGRQALWPVGKRFYAVPETFGPVLDHPQGPLLLRNNVYQGVIGGAEGIIFYESSGFNDNQYPTFRAELDQLRDEFVGSGNLGSVVLSPDPPQVVTHTIVAGPTDPIELDMFEYIRWYERIQYRLAVYDGNVYLLAANIAQTPITVAFQNMPSDETTLEVLFEDGRSVPMANGAFQDSFTAYQVHVYRASGGLQLVDRQFLPLVTQQ